MNESLEMHIALNEISFIAFVVAEQLNKLLRKSARIKDAVKISFQSRKRFL